jgi:hypothetical protein
MDEKHVELKIDDVHQEIKFEFVTEEEPTEEQKNNG